MRDNGDIKNLASAVRYWLSYWDTVSRSNILQEGSLRYSISEVIERKYNGLCVLELPHPCFKNRNIDITWGDDINDDAILEEFTKRVERKANNQLTKEIDKLYQNSDVIECKIVTKHTKYKSEIQRIFNDLCRLYFFKLRYPNRRAFFLLEGGSILFNGIKTGKLFSWDQKNPNSVESPQKLTMFYLKNEKMTDSKPKEEYKIDNLELQKNGEENQHELTILNVYPDWLSFDLKQRTRTLDLKQSEDNGNRSNLERNNSNKTNYDIFLDDYEFKPEISQEVQCKHITFKTFLIALNEASTEIETEHSVAVWEILL